MVDTVNYAAFQYIIDIILCMSSPMAAMTLVTGPSRGSSTGCPWQLKKGRDPALVAPPGASRLPPSLGYIYTRK